MNNYEREELINIIRKTSLPANDGRNRTWYLTRRQATEIVNSIISNKLNASLGSLIRVKETK